MYKYYLLFWHKFCNKLKWKFLVYTVYKIDTKNGKNWKLIYKKVGTNFATLYAKTATTFLFFYVFLKKVVTMVFVF